MFKKLSSLLLILLCVSCGNSQVNSTKSQVLRSEPQLTTLMQAQTVEIRNDWNGYSDITPILRHYKLRVEQQKLVGNAYIAVGGYGAGGIHQQRTTKVKIPAAIVTKFLTTLAKTPLKSGVYQPLIAHPDDYPAIEIKVKMAGKQVIFRSQSQGVDRIPWQITTIDNKITKVYISNSPIPAQAFRVLNPSLDRSGVDQIIQRRLKRRQQ